MKLDERGLNPNHFSSQNVTDGILETSLDSIQKDRNILNISDTLREIKNEQAVT